MNNSKGAVLAVTVGFMLIFILMGLGAVELSGAQGQSTVMRVASSRAFWLADAGIEKARSIMKNGMPSSFPYTDSASSLPFDMRIERAQCQLGLCNNKWVVTSKGKVLNDAGTTLVERKIVATVSKYSIDDALTTNGPIKNFDPSDIDNLPGDLHVTCPDGSCTTLAQQGELLDPYAGISFPSVFGINLANVWSGSTLSPVNREPS